MTTLWKAAGLMLLALLQGGCAVYGVDPAYQVSVSAYSPAVPYYIERPPVYIVPPPVAVYPPVYVAPGVPFGYYRYDRPRHHWHGGQRHHGRHYRGGRGYYRR